jgi:hypothetical protein
VPGVFSAEERRRAEQLAGDRRIQIALEHVDPGVTQVLAAGPELIRRWLHAPAKECYGQAVITAALDARRVGARASLTVGYLAVAAPAFLTPAQQATATPNWFEKAIEYATAPVRGAASCLVPVPAGMGQTAGYFTADYLYQTARAIRRSEAVPDLVWQALVTHHHSQDWRQLAYSAESRSHPDSAIALYRLHAEAGGAAQELVNLLARHGQLQEAIALLRQRGDDDSLSAIVRLVDLSIAGPGELGEVIGLLRQMTEDGDRRLIARLAFLLLGHGEVEEAIALLRQLAHDSDRHAAGRLAGPMADLLTRGGDIKELVALQRQPAPDGDRNEEWPGGLLFGDPVAMLLLWIANGDWAGAVQFVEQGNLLALETTRESGYEVMADLAAAFGEVQELQEMADYGNTYAADRLVNLLADQGRIDDLKAEVRAGTYGAAERLAQMRRSARST